MTVWKTLNPAFFRDFFSERQDQKKRFLLSQHPLCGAMQLLALLAILDRTEFRIPERYA
jgi:hypothetical protein